MRRFRPLLAGLALLLALLLIWQSWRGPENGPAIEAGRGHVVEAPEEETGEALPSGNKPQLAMTAQAESARAGVGPVPDKARAVEPRKESPDKGDEDAEMALHFSWRLIDEAGSAITQKRLRGAGVGASPYHIRYAGRSGLEHRRIDFQGVELEGEKPIEGSVTIEGDLQPGWIEVRVGGLSARADVLEEEDTVDLVLGLPELYTLGSALFEGMDQSGESCWISGMTVRAERTGERLPLLPEFEIGEDGQFVIAWKFHGQPGPYAAAASLYENHGTSEEVRLQAEVSFELIAGEEVRVLVPFDHGRTLRGEVAPAPAEGSKAHVRVLTKSTVGAAMNMRQADIASDGSFELHNVREEDLELAVVVRDPRRKALRMHLFDIGGSEQDLLLSLDSARKPARYRLQETGPHAVGWLRVMNARGTILWSDTFTSRTLIELPAGEYRFRAAPSVQAGPVHLYDLDRAIDAKITAPGTGGVRDLICEFPD